MRRRGFHLTEVLIALALAAGPLLVGLELIQSSTRQARHTLHLATARLLVVELLDLVLAMTGEDIDGLAGAAGGPALDALLAQRVTGMPAELKETYGLEMTALKGHLRCSVDHDVGDLPGLTRVTLVATLPGNVGVSVTRLFRPEARVIPTEAEWDE